jgi:hypothetical protein
MYPGIKFYPPLQGYISKAYRIICPHCYAKKHCTAQATMKKAGYFPSLSVGTDWTHQELSKQSVWSFWQTVVRININCQEIFLGKQQTFGKIIGTNALLTLLTYKQQQ